MKLSASLSLVLAAVATVTASDDHSWQAPGPNDLRSPCPGLNTLANHGFLPRNGSNITIPAVLEAGLEGFNVHQDLLVLAAKASLLVSNLLDQFSLADIQ
ncbi:hypothetical protein MPER_02989, partial [Moniliophthora perniciosa FA553]